MDRNSAIGLALLLRPMTFDFETFGSFPPAHLIPKADRFWTFGKWRGSVRSRGARPPRVPSVAPRDRHGEVRVATCWFFQSPREGAWRCARGRARSPRRSRKDRYSTVHNLGAFGITLLREVLRAPRASAFRFGKRQKTWRLKKLDQKRLLHFLPLQYSMFKVGCSMFIPPITSNTKSR
jgi:hypothetical protein